MSDSRALLLSYLTDHHAGSVGAREILKKAIHSDAPDQELCRFLDREIDEEQEALEAFIGRIDGSVSLPKTVAAWVGEKFSRVRLGHSTESLGRFEMLEGLLLGVRGKLALWEALNSLPPDSLPFGDLNLPDLITRAKAQLQRIESCRRAAFAEMVIS